MKPATITTNIDHATDLLEHLIDQPTSHTTLIICSTRNDFLDQITPTILPPTPPLAPEPREIPPSQESPGDEDEDDDDDDHNDEPTSQPHPPRHRLLTPTLALLARSRNIKLVYCPSVDTLRAYLSGYVVPTPTPTTSYHEGSATSSTTREPTRRPPHPQLTIFNAVALHHATSQFSAQGLSRTFSTAVHAAHHNATSLTLCECSDFHDPTNPHRGPRLWEAEVSLLSDSVRLGGSAGSNFAAARTVSVRRVAGRWFSFEGQRHNIRQEVDEDDNEEMLV